MVEPCFKVDSSAFVADAELLEALERRSSAVICEADRVLFNQGDNPDGLYILHKGDAVLHMHAPGGETVMCMQTSAGSLLGLPALIGDEAYSLTATARKGAELKFVSREDFLIVMGGDPLLSFKVLQVLAAEVRSARQALLAC